MPEKDDVGLFDWHIYADATCAGLSALVPIPLVDLMFEAVFRRRMPGAIARFRNSQMAPGVGILFGRGKYSLLSLQGCLTVPLALVRYVLRKLWRKFIYIFSIKDAASSLTEYWHRAFLLDHMIRAGHVSPGADVQLAERVFSDVLRDIDPSPLMGLARQMVANAHHVFRLLIRARRLGAAEVTHSLAELQASQWQMAEDSLKSTAVRYNERYHSEVSARDAGRIATVKKDST